MNYNIKILYNFLVVYPLSFYCKLSDVHYYILITLKTLVYGVW